MTMNSPASPVSPWDSSANDFLDSYLVASVENPVINGASVLIRGLLADSLFPGKFERLIQEELLYSAAGMFIENSRIQGWLGPLRAALLEGETPVEEELAPPDFLRGPLPFSLEELFAGLAGADRPGWSECFTGPFAERWREALQGLSVEPRPQVLELACGSANDYRYFARYGLAELIDYTGVDFTEKNIENARLRCSQGNFLCASVDALPLADQSVDYTFACDIFEHLPEESLERAFAEALRVTRRELWLSFFALDWLEEHAFGWQVDRPRHVLSCDAVQAFFRERGHACYLVDIPNEWSRRYPGYRHHNPLARVLVVNAATEKAG